jgi:hypothetical protein
MNTPVDEVLRLRGLLAEKERELAELRGLVTAHVEATSDDHDYDLERERAAFERGRDVASREYGDGFAIGHDVALGASEEARPFVAGIREGFDAGQKEWGEVAEKVFAHLHKPGNVRQLQPQREEEREAG